ncbi:cytochrome C oxidase subunit I [Streptomyces platensis]|uniref:cytochrome C oxidase subunit I n=1 Tax=Streptomyces platensis TaxID=58346 RepID=UPI003C2D52D4
MEGYLLWQAEVDCARADAEAAVDALDWPTTAQREELVALLARRQLDVSQLALTRIATRAHQLRGEYQQRYDVLRRRALAAVVGLVAALVLVNALLLAC